MYERVRRWVCISSVVLGGCSVGGSNQDTRSQTGVPAEGSGGGGLTLSPGARGSCDGGSTITIKSSPPGRHTLGASGDDCKQVIDWGDTLDAGTPDVSKPPPHETYE